MRNLNYPGYAAVQSHGLIWAYRWLIARRLSQLGILAAFLLGPWFGIWFVKGNLNSSITLDVLPLTDPYLFLQSLLASFSMTTDMIIGAVIVTVFYMVVGGRVYCSWVCPINIVTDAASWIRTRLNIKGVGTGLSRANRYWLLLLTLVLAVATGTIAWEHVNPVSVVNREIVFGLSSMWLVLLAIFIFDLIISKSGWCGRLCPVGAFYSIVGKLSVLRVDAVNRDKCDDCMDCFAVCPEPQVIKPALKGKQSGHGSMIMSGNCTNCGRCLDVCNKEVFGFSNRFGNNAKQSSTMEIRS